MQQLFLFILNNEQGNIQMGEIMKKASVYLLLICLLSSCSLKYNYEVNPYDVLVVLFHFLHPNCNLLYAQSSTTLSFDPSWHFLTKSLIQSRASFCVLNYGFPLCSSAMQNLLQFMWFFNKSLAMDYQSFTVCNLEAASQKQCSVSTQLSNPFSSSFIILPIHGY